MLNAASSDEEIVSPPLRGTAQPVSWFSRDDEVLRSRTPHGCVSLPDSGDGFRQFAAPRNSAVRGAMMLRDASSPSSEDDRGIAERLDFNGVHASAHQLKRVLAYAEGADEMLLNLAGDVAQQCEVCLASGKAPHPLAPSTYMVPRSAKRYRSTCLRGAAPSPSVRWALSRSFGFWFGFV